MSSGSTIKIPNDILNNERAFFGCMNEIVKRLQSITLGNLLQAPSYADADRPSDLGLTDEGVVIYNITTALLNVWIGTGWTLCDGTPA